MAIDIGAAILGSAAIGGISSFFGSREQAGASEGAAALQLQAARESIQAQERQFKQTREDFAPYREIGTNALQQFGLAYGVTPEGVATPEEVELARERFKTTPGYEFRFGEGIRALDRSASARGDLLSGGYGRELVRYGQGIGSSEYENYINRLAELSGFGVGATSATAGAGASSANAISNALLTGAGRAGQFQADAGTARASGYVGAANALSGGIQNYLFLRALQPQNYATGAA